MKKTEPISLMVTPTTKKRLLEKAKALGLTLTGYLEKVSSEPVIFLDSNSRLLLESLKLNSNVDSM